MLSYGKPVKEVAQLLKLSSRTVEAYLDCIKAKIGCNTKSQAVFLYQQQSSETAYIHNILKEGSLG